MREAFILSAVEFLRKIRRNGESSVKFPAQTRFDGSIARYHSSTIERQVDRSFHSFMKGEKNKRQVKREPVRNALVSSPPSSRASNRRCGGKRCLTIVKMLLPSSAFECRPRDGKIHFLTARSLIDINFECNSHCKYK